jgi:chromosome transmission fidelity protein 18
MEINARYLIALPSRFLSNSVASSDARTGNVIDDRIRPALEAGSRVGNSKPVLVVIDEIDGATGAGENVNNFFIFVPGAPTNIIYRLGALFIN